MGTKISDKSVIYMRKVREREPTSMKQTNFAKIQILHLIFR